MARPVVDLTGKTFGRLTVLRRSTKTFGRNVGWECLCTCGKTNVVAGGRLTSPEGTRSCGCAGVESRTRSLVARNTKHKLSRSRTYQIYQCIKSRCLRETHKHYLHYGGRGIKVCERWLGPNGFLNFVSDMGEAPPAHSIDRIDNNGNYTPDNCRWVSQKQQANNSSRNRFYEKDGVLKTIAEWADEYNIGYQTLYWRLVHTKMPLQDAVSIPLRGRQNLLKRV